MDLGSVRLWVVTVPPRFPKVQLLYATLHPFFLGSSRIGSRKPHMTRFRVHLRLSGAGVSCCEETTVV